MYADNATRKEMAVSAPLASNGQYHPAATPFFCLQM